MKRAPEDKHRARNKAGSSPDHAGPQDPSSAKPEEEDHVDKKPRQQSSSLATGHNISSMSGPDEESNSTLRSSEEKEQTVDLASTLAKKEQETMAGATHREGGKQPSHAHGGPILSGTSQSFPAQLMNLLQRNVASDSIWFIGDGEAIGINRQTIEAKVLNEHFRGMKFNSLIRNLNRWGFRRISHPSLKDTERGYHHLLFQREKPHLLHRMKKDSNAKEVVRQLDLDTDAAQSSEQDLSSAALSNTSEKKSGGASSKIALQHPPSPQQQQNPSTGTTMPTANIDQQRAFSPGSQEAQRQQNIIFQSLAAQQQMRWYQQQAAAAQMQMGPAPTLGGLAGWNFSRNMPSFPHGYYGTGMSQPSRQQAQAGNQAIAQRAAARDTESRPSESKIDEVDAQGEDAKEDRAQGN